MLHSYLIIIIIIFTYFFFNIIMFEFECFFHEVFCLLNIKSRWEFWNFKFHWVVHTVLFQTITSTQKNNNNKKTCSAYTIQLFISFLHMLYRYFTMNVYFFSSVFSFIWLFRFAVSLFLFIAKFFAHMNFIFIYVPRMNAEKEKKNFSSFTYF